MARDPDPSPAPVQGIASWAWNGVEWEPVLVDSTGKLQVGRMSGVEDQLIKIKDLLQEIVILLKERER